jgi:hypothetical protein
MTNGIEIFKSLCISDTVSYGNVLKISETATKARYKTELFRDIRLKNN